MKGIELSNWKPTQRDQLIIDKLREVGPLDVRAISKRTLIPPSSLYRRLELLVERKFLEVDSSARHESTKHYRVPELERNGARITANGNSISFNKFLEHCSRNEPAIASEWQILYQVIAGLARAAAFQIDDEGIVSEASLLELRTKLVPLRETLSNFMSIVDQIMNNEILWKPNDMKESIVTRTDYPITKNDMLAFASLVLIKAGVSE